MARLNGRVANLSDVLAEFMETVWEGFAQPGSKRTVDRRTRVGILAYVRGLRMRGSEPKNFHGLAATLVENGDASAATPENLQRLVTDRQWNPDAVLEAAALQLTPLLIPTALVLRTVRTTRLGEHTYREDDRRPRQRSMLLGLAARVPGNAPTLLVLRWRLAIEAAVWGARGASGAPANRSTGDVYERFKIPVGAEDRSLPELGLDAVASALRCPHLNLPIVAGATYARQRRDWGKQGLGYVVEWRADSRGASTIEADLERECGSEGVEVLDGRRIPVEKLIVAETPHGRETVFATPAPRGHRDKLALRIWCTNLVRGDPDKDAIVRALELGNLRFGLRPVYEGFRDRYGLNDFRGMSYDGWHRHAALVALAHAADIYSAARDDRPDVGAEDRKALLADGSAEAQEETSSRGLESSRQA
jgi:hypothetical protein